MQTRREFLMTSVAACVLCGVPGSPPGQTAQNAGAPLLYIGDPYTAHADECGLGGRSFDEARERALRFRTPDTDRDRFVLGLEV